MGAFSNIDGLVNALTGGASGNPETIFFYKDSRISGAAPTAPVLKKWHTLWNVIGFPAHGAFQGASARYCDNATDGGLKQADHAASYQKWLLGGQASSTQPGCLMLYDRLADYGALAGNTTSPQSCTLTLSSRYTGSASVGNMLMVEIGTAVGGTSRLITADYTDQDGNSGVTSESGNIGNTGDNEAGRMTLIPFAQGDTGIRGISSVTLSGNTAAAGAFSVVIIRPLLYWFFNESPSMAITDLVSSVPGPMEIKTDACLALAWLAGSTTWPQIHGYITMCEVAD